MLVLGIDKAKKGSGRARSGAGWVGVVLDEDGFVRSHFSTTVADLAASEPDAAVVTIDIPIGLATTGRRRADADARAVLGPGGRSSSVFLTPVRSAVEAGSREEADRLSRRAGDGGVGSTAFGLATSILEVDSWIGSGAGGGRDVREVHPEVCFAMMGGRTLAGKSSWNGAAARRTLLVQQGVALPDDLGAAGLVHGNDVLDAAAAAWTARRIALGLATSYPSPPEDLDGWPTAIWA
jgi:predicted RNase H-like nuclease